MIRKVAADLKNSIRGKVALIFICLMALMLVLIGLCEFLFVERFYISRKEKILLESWNWINAVDETALPETFESFCSVNGLTYSVTDQNLEPLLTNGHQDTDMSGRLFGNILGMEDENSKVLEETDRYKMIRIQDRFSSMEYLELWGTLENGHYYIVLTPLQSISDAALISAQFYAYIGLVVVVLGAAAIWLVTKRIVQPVQELTELSKRMADLDFDAQYTSGGSDEIGVLGENFNVMSRKLQEAIGELKTANVKLQKDIEEKTQIDEMRKEFISNVSHELKTPIALIQGYAEGLRDNVIDDPESREYYCDVIIDESGKMNTLVRQLLTLNRLEFGNDLPSMERFSLTDVIKGVLQSSSLMIEQAGARVIFEPDGPYAVWGDEFKIEEVVTNYLTNALNHLDGEKIIEIRLAEENGIVTATVFNTGEPIPTESLDRIWDKFYKVDKARTRAYGGSGIGLSIVKAIMDSHNQTCSVKNYENGVAFSFTLEAK